jgi:hypothetical protein
MAPSLLNNPLKGKSRSARKDIGRTIGKGRPVEDRENAADAITYANWSLRMYGVLMILFSLVGTLNVVIGLTAHKWITFGSGVLFLAGAVLFLFLIGRVRRSVPLNRALLDPAVGGPS